MAASVGIVSFLISALAARHYDAIPHSNIAHTQGPVESYTNEVVTVINNYIPVLIPERQSITDPVVVDIPNPVEQRFTFTWTEFAWLQILIGFVIGIFVVLISTCCFPCRQNRSVEAALPDDNDDDDGREAPTQDSEHASSPEDPEEDPGQEPEEEPPVPYIDRGTQTDEPPNETRYVEGSTQTETTPTPPPAPVQTLGQSTILSVETAPVAPEPTPQNLSFSQIDSIDIPPAAPTRGLQPPDAQTLTFSPIEPIFDVPPQSPARELDAINELQRQINELQRSLEAAQVAIDNTDEELFIQRDVLFKERETNKKVNTFLWNDKRKMEQQHQDAQANLIADHKHKIQQMQILTDRLMVFHRQRVQQDNAEQAALQNTQDQAPATGVRDGDAAPKPGPSQAPPVNEDEDDLYGLTDDEDDVYPRGDAPLPAPFEVESSVSDSEDKDESDDDGDKQDPQPDQQPPPPEGDNSEDGGKRDDGANDDDDYDNMGNSPVTPPRQRSYSESHVNSQSPQAELEMLQEALKNSNEAREKAQNEYKESQERLREWQWHAGDLRDNLESERKQKQTLQYDLRDAEEGIKQMTRHLFGQKDAAFDEDQSGDRDHGEHEQDSEYKQDPQPDQQTPSLGGDNSEDEDKRDDSVNGDDNDDDNQDPGNDGGAGAVQEAPSTESPETTPNEDNSEPSQEPGQSSIEGEEQPSPIESSAEDVTVDPGEEELLRELDNASGSEDEGEEGPANTEDEEPKEEDQEPGEDQVPEEYQRYQRPDEENEDRGWTSDNGTPPPRSPQVPPPNRVFAKPKGRFAKGTEKQRQVESTTPPGSPPRKTPASASGEGEKEHENEEKEEEDSDLDAPYVSDDEFPCSPSPPRPPPPATNSHNLSADAKVHSQEEDPKEHASAAKPIQSTAEPGPEHPFGPGSVVSSTPRPHVPSPFSGPQPSQRPAFPSSSIPTNLAAPFAAPSNAPGFSPALRQPGQAPQAGGYIPRGPPGAQIPQASQNQGYNPPRPPTAPPTQEYNPTRPTAPTTQGYNPTRPTGPPTQGYNPQRPPPSQGPNPARSGDLGWTPPPARPAPAPAEGESSPDRPSLPPSEPNPAPAPADEETQTPPPPPPDRPKLKPKGRLGRGARVPVQSKTPPGSPGSPPRRRPEEEKDDEKEDDEKKEEESDSDPDAEFEYDDEYQPPPPPPPPPVNSRNPPADAEEHSQGQATEGPKSPAEPVQSSEEPVPEQQTSKQDAQPAEDASQPQAPTQSSPTDGASGLSWVEELREALEAEPVRSSEEPVPKQKTSEQDEQPTEDAAQPQSPSDVASELSWGDELLRELEAEPVQSSTEPVAEHQTAEQQTSEQDNNPDDSDIDSLFDGDFDANDDFGTASPKAAAEEQSPAEPLQTTEKPVPEQQTSEQDAQPAENVSQSQAPAQSNTTGGSWGESFEEEMRRLMKKPIRSLAAEPGPSPVEPPQPQTPAQPSPIGDGRPIMREMEESSNLFDEDIAGSMRNPSLGPDTPRQPPTNVASDLQQRMQGVNAPSDDEFAALLENASLLPPQHPQPSPPRAPENVDQSWREQPLVLVDRPESPRQTPPSPTPSSPPQQAQESFKRPSRRAATQKPPHRPTPAPSAAASHPGPEAPWPQQQQQSAPSQPSQNTFSGMLGQVSEPSNSRPTTFTPPGSRIDYSRPREQQEREMRAAAERERQLREERDARWRKWQEDGWDEGDWS